MEFKVRLFLGDELIDPSDYDKIRINCPDVDRIVNEIYERNERRPLTRAELDALDDELDDEPDDPPAAGKPSVLKKLQRNQELVKQRDAMKRQKRYEPVTTHTVFRRSYISQFLREKTQIYCGQRKTMLFYEPRKVYL